MSRTDKMRKKLDPEKTRATILEAAYEQFASTGYSGTSIGDIAKKAEVPKSLVQYHFGTKEELWHECLIRKAGPMLAAVDRLIAGESSNLVELARARIEVHQRHPLISRLLAWASLEAIPLPGGITEKAKRIRARYEQDPEQFEHLLLAFATIDGWFLYKPLYGRLIGEIDATVEHRLTECVEQWVKP